MVRFRWTGNKNKVRALKMEYDYTLLREISLFRGMTDEEIESCVPLIDGKLLVAEKDEFIIKNGDEGRYIGIIVKGQGLIIQDDIWGHRNIVGTALPDDTFAEPFSLFRIHVPLSVIATEKTVYFNFDPKMVVIDNPQNSHIHTLLTNNFITLLNHKIMRLVDKITHTTQRSTKAKILSYLNTCAYESQALTFTIPYNRQQLADYLGVERAAMTVVLSELRKEGLISFRKNTFTLIENSLKPDSLT